MPLDPSIPLAARGPRIEYDPINPINAMLQGEQLRGAQQANALRQLQMQQSQREMEQEEVANRLLANAISPEGEIDYNRVIQGMAGAGQAGKLPALLAQREQARLQQAQIAAAQANRQKAMLDQALSVLKGANEQNYPTLRSAIISQAPALGQFFPETYDKSSIDALVGRVQEQVKVLTGSPGAQFLRQNPQTGQMEVMHTVPFKPAEPAAPQKPMVLGPSSIAVDPTTGQVVARGPRAEAPAPAAAAGAAPSAAAESGLSRKEIERRNAAFPKASNALKAFDASSDEMIAKLTELSQSPGLNEITGLVGGRIVGITDAGRRAQALFDTVAARGQFQELQQMRDASPTGGALGNVSNREGELLRAAFAAIDRRQSKADVQKEIKNVIAKIQASKARVREAFEETYDYRTNQPEQATPAVGATPRAAPAEAVPASRSRPSGGLTPQEQQELEQLRARFKK